jgi:uncharacterized protein YbjT (DUF2867 family)
MKKAILFGASGLVGSHLLDILLNHPDYEQVIIVVRKNLNSSHPKLKTLTGDYHSLPNLKDDIEADEVFITLGTTKNKTPDQKVYYQIDHDYPVLAAKIAQERGAKSVFIVTAVGANANSSVFYIRTKGEAERDIIAVGLDHTHIFRPSMILGNRKENRPLERVFMKVWPAISSVLTGRLSKYRGMEARDIAQAMVNAAKNQREKVAIYHWKEMKELL